MGSSFLGVPDIYVKVSLRGKLLRFHGEPNMMKVRIDMQGKRCRAKHLERGQFGLEKEWRWQKKLRI